MPSRREAFTLLEVLLSVFLLFGTGLALMKFDLWIKEETERYRNKANLLYRQTPLLYAPPGRARKRETTVYDAVRFTKLRDDEIFWLKRLEGGVEVGKEVKKSLFQSGDLELTYRLLPVRLRDEKASVGFVRVLP